MQLENIKIVLVKTSHPGNIGAAARAMKTMGLSQLVLVSPKDFPNEQATAMAAGAKDLLENVQIVANLDEALADCQLVIGASARNRSGEWPNLTVQQVGELIGGQPGLVPAKTEQTAQIALVFGQENSGLTNSELDKCHYLAQIPVNPDYGSLNLAAAVQIFCYEIRRAKLQPGLVAEGLAAKKANNKLETQLANQQEFEGFFQQLATTLLEIEFLKLDDNQKMLRKLRQLYKKANLTAAEISILRGILTATQKQTK